MAINGPRARDTGGFDPLIGMESRDDRQNTQDPLRGTLNGLDQKIAMGNAMDSLSNTERYQLANPGNAPYSAASAAPGSSAAASAERTTNSIMTTLRDNIATQRATTPATASLSPPAGAPAFADGGSVTSEADEYARQAAEIEAEQLRQAGVKPAAAPVAAPAPATAKPKSLLGGVMGLFSNRKAQIDKAVDGYARGGVVGFDAGGSLDPTLNEQITQARIGNAGGASPETALRQSAAAGKEAQAAFDAEVRSRAPGVAKYSASSTPSVPVQPTVAEQITQARLGNAGGVPPEALARQQLAEQAATVARNDAEVRARIPSKAPSVPASASAPGVPSAASVPSVPSVPSAPSPAVTPGVTSSASVPPTAGSARIGGVPGVDSNRWSTTSGMQGPGNTPADVQAQATRAAENTKFAEDVKARTGARPQGAAPKPDFVMEDMEGKGKGGAKMADSVESARAKAEQMKPGKPGAATAAESATTASPGTSQAAKVSSSTPKSYGAGRAAGSAVRTGVGMAKQAAVMAPLAGFGDYHIVGDEVDSSAAGTFGYIKEGEFGRAGDSLKKGAVEAGLDSLSGIAKTGDFVTGIFGYRPKWADRLATSVNEQLGDIVTTPLDEEQPAKYSKPGTADAPLERVSSGAMTETTPTPPTAGPDARFTPDENPQMPSGAIRVGPSTGAIPGTATVSADQMPAPQRGGYITGPDGRALFVPESAPAARDPNGTYDAYGNNRAPTIQMQKELRDMQRAGFEADLKSPLPFYQARGMRGLTALNSDPDVAAENAQALEQTRAQNRTAELQTQAGLEGIAAQELTAQLQGVTDPAKRQALIDQATATKGRYTLVQDEETETPMGTKLKGRQRIWDNKLGRYADDGRQEQAAAPTADEVAILKKNNSPAFIKVFEEKYGKGAAEKALRGFAHGGVITPDMYLGKEMSVEPPNLLDSAGKVVDSLPYAAAQFIPGAGVPLGAAAAAVHAAQGRTEELPLDVAAMVPGGKGVMLAKGAKLAAKRAIGGVGRAANTIQALGAADAFGSPAYANGGCVKLADGGGVIQGAGSGTSDSVAAHVAETGQPIRVSQGEYELSPEVVARVGVEKLNALIDKYHKGESRAVPQGSFIIPADVVNRLGRSYFDYLAKPK